MITTLPLPFAPLVLQLFGPFSNLVEATFRRLIRPPPESLVRGVLADLPRGRAELIAKNALLRQPLLTLRVQR